ncbi:MAG: radical SAM protein [Desulfarculus sp.]|nr:radical SAM protein [Desulfarculus sp.]
MARLLVSELFVSIQGESSFAGWPCAFLRLAGCPLACRWCDSLYARQGGQPLELDQALAWTAGQGVDLVEVTGGEPLAQPASLELIRRLCDLGRTVLVETSGALDIAPVDPRARVIMDIKCPSSGMHERLHRPNLEALKPHHEVKLVLADRADYEYARAMLAEHGLSQRCQVLLSTVHGQLAPAQAVEWMLADRLPARFQLQLHKYIWPGQERGV